MFTVGVVAHESRLAHAEQLSDTIQADVFCLDDAAQRLGCERNHKRCWKTLAGHNTDWLLVVEDDAEPVPDFRNQVNQALAVAPAPYVSLYLGTGYPRQWQQRYRETIAKSEADPDICWAITSGWMMHAVAIAIRTQLVPNLLKHLDNSIGVPIDKAIGQHARNTKQPVAYTLPSLVNHADTPTIHVHQDGQPRPPGRRAWTTGTRTTWTSKSIQMG